MFGVITRVALGRQVVRRIHMSPSMFMASKIEVGDPEVQKEIKDIVSKNKLVVFMKGDRDQPQCGFSRAVIQILDMHQVKDYKDIDVIASTKFRDGVKDFTKWPTIPQVFVDGEFVGGCDIMIQMHRSGQLAEIFDKAGIKHEPLPDPPAKKSDDDDDEKPSDSRQDAKSRR